MLAAIGVLLIIAMATTSYVHSATQTIRLARNHEMDVVLTNGAEAGLEDILISLWKPFKVEQNFDDLDAALDGASENSPASIHAGSTSSGAYYVAGVIGYSKLDTYNRLVTLRSVSWDDADNDGIIDEGETRKVLDVQQIFSLERSPVFDYTYFVNNYGWMQGFSQWMLQVNGDMRANGDFDFSGGTPTINGSVYASANNKLVPPAPGYVNITPYQQTNSAYNGVNDPRRRQGYDPVRHGAKGSETYEKWRDFIYDQQGDIVTGRLAGSVVGDSRGYRRYNGQTLDPTPTREVVMPDLDDISKYVNISLSYVDDRPVFDNGNPNPDFGQGAYVKVWNASLNQYVRVDTNGVVSGSAILIGSSSKPILIHGPVTFTTDVVIKGYVQGQGTLYAGRNVHIVGSIRYKNPPDFRGSNPQQVDNNNSSKDLLALAARGSIMMGNVSKFGFPYPLKYMTPPFTKGRYDEFGNWTPPFNATEIDYTGRKKYQSVYADSVINSISEPINVLDCILYTNFTGGGRLGEGGGGVTFNGSIISKDEAMVIYSLPMVMNYDHRIRERTLSQKPLIDIKLPRTPSTVRAVWQDRGLFISGG
ncbi:MAG: hypothetical protein C4341_09005 [Armatimonadota bacterium]